MIDLAAYPIISTLSVEEKANYYDAIMKKYRKEKYESHLITERVKMCFDFSCIDIDKCKAWNEVKERERKESSSLGGIRSGEARRAKKAAREQAEQQDEETAPPSYEVPEVEQVESYPFDEFWRIYDKNVGKRKCQQIWKQISEETKAKIMAHVVEYVKTREKRLRKDPCNYFAEHTWEDEIISNNQSAISYGSNNEQQDGRTQQQINIERNAQAVARMFNEIRPMQPENGGGY